jgi:Cu/Ag efflux protein CusF
MKSALTPLLATAALLAAALLHAEDETSSPFAKGTLESLDLSRSRLALQTKTGITNFVFDAQTRVFRQKKRITIDQLKTGEVVALRFLSRAHDAPLAQIIKAPTDEAAASTNGAAPPAPPSPP